MRWLELRYGVAREPAASARWVVVDCETSGLDPTRDRLLSLAGVGVKGRCISPGDCFAAVLRQQQPSSRENILVHGIGEQQQALGQAPEAALEAFLAFAAHAPRVA
jgi:DNA polymerase-3 subunit epsilon